MSEQLSIHKEVTDNHLLLVLHGRIDAYWSVILGEQIETSIHDGYYDILIDVRGITYMSSAGIRILLTYYKKLKEIQGSFVLVHPSIQVSSILEMSGLKMLMQVQESQKPVADSTRIHEYTIDQSRFTIQTLAPDECLQGRIQGSPEFLITGDANPVSIRSIPFHSQQYGIGIGAFGDSNDDFHKRMGEFIGLGDVIACLPTDGRKKPDYLIRYGQLIPQVNLLYGLLFEGKFSHIIRFDVLDPERGIPFSQLINQIHGLVPFNTAGLLMVAETSGLVGVSLTSSPVDGGSANNLFAYPDIKEQVTFTTEPGYDRMLTLTTGVASLDSNEVYTHHLKPLSAKIPMRGHFHTAVFSYHPMKKQWKDPQEVIKKLAEEHQFETILHLIHDERPHVGAGESEFRTGTCWFGKMNPLNLPI